MILKMKVTHSAHFYTRNGYEEKSLKYGVQKKDLEKKGRSGFNHLYLNIFT